MKITCEVTSVGVGRDSTGNPVLTVDLKGKATTAAEWRPDAGYSIDVPDTLTTRRTFFVGRKVEILVRAL